MTKDLFEISLDRLFSKLYKIMVNQVTFVGFRGVGDWGRRLGLDLGLICRPKCEYNYSEKEAPEKGTFYG